MKIYFACALSARKQRAGSAEFLYIYQCIVNHLKKYGEVLTEHLTQEDVFEFESKLIPAERFNRDIRWLEEADLVVAEVSIHSTGIGYEIGRSERLGKKLICLFNNKNGVPSAMISGNESLHLIKYDSIEEALEKMDKRLSLYPFPALKK